MDRDRRPDGKDKTGGTGGPDASLNQEARARIGQKLKDYYQDIVNEPIPDRLRGLIEELQRREQSETRPSE